MPLVKGGIHTLGDYLGTAFACGLLSALCALIIGLVARFFCEWPVAWVIAESTFGLVAGGHALRTLVWRKWLRYSRKNQGPLYEWTSEASRRDNAVDMLCWLVGGSVGGVCGYFLAQLVEVYSIVITGGICLVAGVASLVVDDIRSRNWKGFV